MENLKYHSILCAAYISKYFLKQRNIVLELSMLGEIPFLAPIVREFSRHREGIRLLIATQEEPEKYVAKLNGIPEYAALFDGVPMIPKNLLLSYPGLIDVFASSEQYCYGLPGVSSVCFFHGQPSKGVTFSPAILQGFDYFFLMGDLQLQALVTFLKKNRGTIDYLPKTVNVGYPKMDAIVNGDYKRIDVLTSLGMDPLFKTVLYAPAFNEGASLRSIGLELVQCLASIQNINLIIKLAPDMYNSTDNIYATGGINWFDKLAPLESSRLRIITDPDSNPSVAVADVMVTDISSIAFDFLYLDKPVIYYDCPDFYALFTAQRAPYFSFEEFLHNDTINAGRNFGRAVQNLVDLKTAVIDSLENPMALSRRRHELIPWLLYNPGSAAVSVVEELCNLAQNPVRQNHRRQNQQTELGGSLGKLSPCQIQALLKFYFTHYREDTPLAEFYADLTKSDPPLAKIDSSRPVSYFESVKMDDFFVELDANVTNRAYLLSAGHSTLERLNMAFTSYLRTNSNDTELQYLQDQIIGKDQKTKPEATIKGYIDAKATVAEATKAGLSICDYRESTETDQRKKGRRNRIISALEARGVLGNSGTICEIGAGTGMYLEKIIESCKPACYEVYETAPDWVTYLGDTYGSLTDLKLHVADGYSLRYTRDNSCDLVHAHAVFVYLPMLQVMEYLIECARVCAPGGYIVFDSFLDTSFSYADAKDWLSGEWRFPVIIPRNVIMGLAEEYSLKSYGEFREIYGYSHVNYLIFRKQIS